MDIADIWLRGVYNKGEGYMNNWKIARIMISSGIALISVGILNILAEASSQIKTFLTLNKAVGPYSGKILFSIIIGIIICLLMHNKNKDVNLKNYFKFLIIALLIATLFVFTPFINLLGK